MIDALMEKYRYFMLNVEVRFFYHDHCIVSKHRDKQEQPILMKDMMTKGF